MFSEELKQGTAAAHLDLERKMIPHLKQIGSRLEYARLLNYMLGFYQPLENRLAPYMHDFDLQSHAANIRKDIAAVDPGFSLSDDEAVDLPAIDSREKALGVLYVMEGSTLGGQIITKMLGKQIEDAEIDAFSFYNPYGEATMQKWKAFKEHLNQPFSEDQKQAVIIGANETFNSLNNWITKYGSDNGK